MTTLTPELLRDYADAFRTYGRLPNSVWFLRLKESGGRNLDEASRKLVPWHEKGRPLTQGLTDLDLDSDHRGSDYLRTEGKLALLQTA